MLLVKRLETDSFIKKKKKSVILKSTATCSHQHPLPVCCGRLHTFFFSIQKLEWLSHCGKCSLCHFRDSLATVFNSWHLHRAPHETFQNSTSLGSRKESCEVLVSYSDCRRKTCPL